MNICVAGWHFHAPFVHTLVASKYTSCLICHRMPSGLELGGLDCEMVRNVGLEFGCYDRFLKNKWQEGPVFFSHDDNELTESMLDEISGIPHDQCFLFGSKEQAEANGMAHGRAFFCSEKLLRRLKADGGFWYDEGPMTSVVVAATTAEGPNYHNLGIQTFVAYLKSLPPEFTVNQVGIVPGLKLGYRGRL